MKRSKVVILKTDPKNIIVDYSKLMHLAQYERYISQEVPALIKLNLSWTKYFPSCSSQPWQVEGVIKALIEDGFNKNLLYPVENKTVVTNPKKEQKII